MKGSLQWGTCSKSLAVETHGRTRWRSSLRRSPSATIKTHLRVRSSEQRIEQSWESSHWLVDSKGKSFFWSTLDHTLLGWITLKCGKFAILTVPGIPSVCLSWRYSLHGLCLLWTQTQCAGNCKGATEAQSTWTLSYSRCHLTQSSRVNQDKTCLA